MWDSWGLNPEAVHVFLAAEIQQKAILWVLFSLLGSWHRGKAVNIHFRKLCIRGDMGEESRKSTEQANTQKTSGYAKLAAAGMRTVHFMAKDPVPPLRWGLRQLGKQLCISVCAQGSLLAVQSAKKQAPLQEVVHCCYKHLVYHSRWPVASRRRRRSSGRRVQLLRAGRHLQGCVDPRKYPSRAFN